MKKKFNIEKIPGVIILICLIFVAPLGIWLFYKKSIANKKNMYNKANSLMWLGLFVLFLLIVGCYSKIKEIISLYSSGMSLDMIDLAPDNIWLYIIGIIMVSSYFVGSKKIKEYLVKERKIIKMINLDKEYSLKKMTKSLSIDLNNLIEKINHLQNYGYLVPIEIDIEKKKIMHKNYNLTSKQIKCTKCGALISLKKDEYIECDFCGHGLIEEK